MQRDSNLVYLDRLESLSGSNPSLQHRILPTHPSAVHIWWRNGLNTSCNGRCNL